MAPLPVEVLLGIYLGLLTGFIPALVAWSLGFLFKYFTGVSVPALAVVVLGVALAGANGGLLALVDPTVTTHPNSERVVVAIIVVMMMSLYAHSQGDRLGTAFPHHFSLRKLRERTLSADVVELVGGHGQVRVTVAGEVGDIEGYPPLPADLRAEIRTGEWPFPADLPLTEIERRVEDRLRTTFQLAEVNVTLDERGRAHVAAAPGTHGVSSRVPAGERAVSIEGLVPTGLARGDQAAVVLADGEVHGTVVSAQSSLDGSASPAVEPTEAPDEPDGTEVGSRPATQAATADGGDGRVTLAVPRDDAERLLSIDRTHFVITSRGVRGEFELLQVLRRVGARLRKLRVGDSGELAGTTLGEADIRDRFSIEVLAVRPREGGWTVAPGGETGLEPGTEVFVVGTASAVNRFQEALG